MRQDPIPAAVADRLSDAARRLRAARRSALDRVAVEETEWEYAGRTWSWPAGEARTYFRELAPGEREVLDELTAALGRLRSADGTGSGAESRAEVVGIGTGRVAVSIPGTVGEGPGATGGGRSEATGGDPLVAKLARYGPSAEMGDGRPQNRRERRIWSAVGSHPFLPVLDGDADGDWIAMPRADVPPDEAVGEAALDGVRAALAPHRDRFHFDELKPENVGAYRDRYWIVDYGRPAGEPLFAEPPDAPAGDADGTGNTDETGNIADTTGTVDTTDTAEVSRGDARKDRQDRSREN